MIKEAIKYLSKHRFIVFLSSLGIAISIALVLTINFLSSSLKQELNKQLDLMGASSINLTINKDKLEPNWYEYLIDNKVIKNISAVDVDSTMIGNDIYSVYKVNNDYFDIMKLEVQSGYCSFLKKSQVAVIGSLVKGVNISDYIKVNDKLYQVIGVLKSDSFNMMESFDEKIFIPNNNYLNHNYILTAFSKADIQTYLELKFKDDEYQLVSNEDFNDSMMSVMSLINNVLNVIAFISLVVAIVGLMSFTYVTSNTRNKEWGIRKSFGATRKDIMIQLLLETALIALIGFIEGMIISFMMGYGISALLDFKYYFDYILAIQIASFTILLVFIFNITIVYRVSSKQIVDCLDNV